MNVCSHCGREFANIDALNGHSKVHKDNYLDVRSKNITSLINTNNEGRNKRISEYEKNKKKCLFCGRELEYDQSHKKFCNSSCSALWNNEHRDYSLGKDNRSKIAFCANCGIQISVSVRAGLKTLCAECRKIRKPRIRLKLKNGEVGINSTVKVFKKDMINECVVCGSKFKGIAKTCSKECNCRLMSLHRMRVILESGTNNFHTKRGKFTYKNAVDIECDSNLEKAAIVYMIDILNVEKIERYRNVINFWMGDFHKIFNPDFISWKNGQTYIVEAKMKWSSTSIHPYNFTIPCKKEALAKFCEEKGYQMIWLDFSYDVRFRRIYKDVRKGIYDPKV